MRAFAQDDVGVRITVCVVNAVVAAETEELANPRTTRNHDATH